MPRILAIDYGIKRSGIAVTDPLKIIASPLETVVTTDLISFLKKYFEKEKVEALVIGDPKNLRGEENDLTAIVYDFISVLKKEFPDIPVHLIDERFTSKMASRIIGQSGMGKMKRQQKELLDKVSASIILQTYIDKFHT